VVVFVLILTIVPIAYRRDIKWRAILWISRVKITSGFTASIRETLSLIHAPAHIVTPSDQKRQSSERTGHEVQGVREVEL